MEWDGGYCIHEIKWDFHPKALVLSPNFTKNKNGGIPSWSPYHTLHTHMAACHHASSCDLAADSDTRTPYHSPGTSSRTCFWNGSKRLCEKLSDFKIVMYHLSTDTGNHVSVSSRCQCSHLCVLIISLNTSIMSHAPIVTPSSEPFKDMTPGISDWHSRQVTKIHVPL